MLKIKVLDKKVRRMLNPAYIQKATRSSINKVGGLTRTALSKQTRKVYNVKAARIKTGVTTKRGSNAKPVYTLKYQGHKLSLMNFGAKKTKRGVTIRIKKAGGRRLIKGGFIAMGNVWRRKKSSRLPIVRRVTLSIVNMINNIEPAKLSRSVYRQNFKEIFSKDMRYYYDRSK